MTANNKRESYILNGIAKHGSFITYLQSLNENTLKNYQAPIQAIKKRLCQENQLTAIECEEIESYLESHDKQKPKYFEQYFKSFNESMSFLKDGLIIDSRINILFLSVFSLYSIDTIRNIKLSDIKFKRDNEQIQIYCAPQNISFLFLDQNKLFEELILLCSSIKRATLLKDKDSKIDYSYINKYINLYFDIPLQKGGLRTLRNILQANNILQKN